MKAGIIAFLAGLSLFLCIEFYTLSPRQAACLFISVHEELFANSNLSLLLHSDTKQMLLKEPLQSLQTWIYVVKFDKTLTSRSV